MFSFICECLLKNYTDWTLSGVFVACEMYIFYLWGHSFSQTCAYCLSQWKPIWCVEEVFLGKICVCGREREREKKRQSAQWEGHSAQSRREMLERETIWGVQ